MVTKRNNSTESCLSFPNHLTLRGVYAILQQNSTESGVLKLKQGGELMRGWLKDARLEHGMTQLQVANKLDITESYYSLIENGDRQKKMDISLVSKLSVVFGLPVQEIVSLESSDE